MVLEFIRPRKKREEEDEEEYLIRPTEELEKFINTFDEAISDLSRLQISGVFYMSPRVKWFYDNAILVLKSWAMFADQYSFLFKNNSKEFFNKVFESTRAVTGFDKEYQIKLVVKFRAFIEEVYRTAYSTLQVLWTGLWWFMTQGRVDLRYILQPYLGSKQPLILPTFGEGEKSE